MMMEVKGHWWISGRRSSKHDWSVLWLVQTVLRPTLMNSVCRMFFFPPWSQHVHDQLSVCLWCLISVCFKGDVFIQRTHDERNPIVYAVFSTAGWDNLSYKHLKYLHFHSKVWGNHVNRQGICRLLYMNSKDKILFEKKKSYIPSNQCLYWLSSVKLVIMPMLFLSFPLQLCV